MVKYKLLFSSQAQKDAIKLKRAGLKQKVNELLDLIETNPLSYPPKYNSQNNINYPQLYKISI